MIAAVVLAAGGASRFVGPRGERSQKVVAPLRGVPLVRHVVTAVAAVADSVIVVTGHEAATVSEALRGTGVRVVENPEWRAGLGTSLACGVRALPPGTEAVIVALGDQPALDTSVLRSLVARWRDTKKPIVAIRYGGIVSPPALFARAVFPELEQLGGDGGARWLIERAADRVAAIDVDEPPPADVDTQDDLRALSG